MIDGIGFAVLVPPEMSPGTTALLVVASFFTSAGTAAFAVGGGLTLLAVMSTILPVAVLVPLHGIVQFASNAGRLIVLRGAIRWGTLAPFAVGAVLGAALGARFVVALPEPILQTVLAVFILLLALLRPPAVATDRPAAVLAATGFVSTALSMFVGATGPLNAAVLKPILAERRALVATLAAATGVQHALKSAAFLGLGVALGPYLGLAAAMIATGFLGTLAGARLLAWVPERLFRRVLTGILIVVAAELLRRGVGGLLAGRGERTGPPAAFGTCAEPARVPQPVPDCAAVGAS